MNRCTIKKTLAVLLSSFALFMSFAAYGQEKDSSHAVENKAEIPALTKFHSVIYQVWHNAWPNKDYELLAKLLPDIEKHAAEVVAAELPGILHEKQAVWDTNIKALQEIVSGYKTAVEKKDNEKLLDAAENLHSQYEKLVQVVRPVLKEINAFHETLYLLYHQYLPAYDLEKIRASVSELQTKTVALNKAVLPERLKNKSAAFEEARKKLDASVNALAATLPSNDEKKIKAAIETMHSDYEALQGIFD